MVKLLSLGRSAAKWYPLHAPAVLRRVEIEFQAPHVLVWLSTETHWLTSTQVLRERATALEATVVAVDAEVTCTGDGAVRDARGWPARRVPRLFLGDAAEGSSTFPRRQR